MIALLSRVKRAKRGGVGSLGLARKIRIKREIGEIQK
jgi:hypothetical protein